MSYDLFVFDPASAPASRDSLNEWFTSQAENPDACADPSFASERLQHWFTDAIKVFPALNGPAAPPDAGEADMKCADYNILSGSIFVSFMWSDAEQAADVIPRLAAVHGLGLCDPQDSSGKGWYLPKAGRLEPLKSSSKPSLVSKLSSFLRRSW